MRLTLRTLLAYLDDILEPGDHAEIGNRINESEFATDLVHRTRDVLRRQQLGAPPPIGHGIGMDANTVSDYLDNTMASEQVAQFEKVCLESDAHLAETAACHQILTLVLGQPAELGRVNRQRMYSVAKASEVPPVPSRQAPPPPPPPAESRRSPRRPPEIPEYLRESSRSRRRGRWGVALVAAALAGLVATAAMRPELFRSLWGHDASTDVSRREEPSQGRSPPSRLPGAPDDSAASPPPVADRPLDRVTPRLNEDDAPEATVSTADALIPPEKEPAFDEPDLNPAVSEISQDGGRLSEAPRETVEDTPTRDEGSQPDVPAAATGGSVGLYLPGNNILLRHEKASGEWQRLTPRTVLNSGDHLLALPTYRPTIAFSGGITVQIAGETSIVLGGTLADGIPILDIQYGRVVILGVGQAGAQIRLRWDDTEHLVTMVDANTTLAVQVQRKHRPGADPESRAGDISGNVYVAAGSVQWRPDEPAVAAPSHWVLPDGAPRPAGDEIELAAWINSEQVSEIDQRASQALEAALTPERPVSLGLRELVNGRRVEVRSLANRSSVYVGQFEPFVAGLNDSDQRANWYQQVETLQAAMANGPDVAAAVRETFIRKREEKKGLELYRMLWCYSDQELIDGADRELVDYLEHDDTDFRVLASWNLMTITGAGAIYRPEFTSSRHQQIVRRWRDRLAAEEIRWKHTP